MNNQLQIQIEKASDAIKKNYQKGVHHVACLLTCGDNDYYGLHVDSHGIDTCAEPTAIAAAKLAGETSFDTIVSVYWSGRPEQEPEVVPPCGNCRQTLYDIAPRISVILVDQNGEHVTKTITELFPFAYQKPNN